MAHSESASPMKKLHGKVAIVTGGASGIGEATARLFAEHGARAVVIADIHDEKGRTVAESIGSQRCSYVHCDVSDEEQVKSMVDGTEQLEKYDYAILDLDLSQLDHLIQVNARGNAACVKHAARAMVEQKVRGSIVCTASVVVSNWKGGDMTDYTMSKYAVIGLVRSASQQLGVHGIRVNSVSPSAIATRLSSSTGLTSDLLEKLFVPFTSLKGIMLTVEHIADAVLFLASEDSAFITGHDLVVDGGLISLPHL
ncbi:(-)-isopiperitenol (-)-carveol dehydrogenase, mitochondrial-like [Olea europaea subsp. europaea]|uniref:(-)-isopiperitenol (-)-carveol dehydrogenase, mitochondrial-like n=1 Tax=Olea europaea subsp. europaea TaxID=158383 RepID=A0A8S0T9R3_OLEEU|nr:(-)-isopiperitenol (-)-carveol dehydrogenase, mitochondrial-like [Olea europaea subsp. europaea]